jgi:hypothetical protein
MGAIGCEFRELQFGALGMHYCGDDVVLREQVQMKRTCSRAWQHLHLGRMPIEVFDALSFILGIVLC